MREEQLAFEERVQRLLRKFFHPSEQLLGNMFCAELLDELVVVDSALLRD